ncbi:MAG: lipid-A-disaccharide synthase [Cyanothece sp. SIO1E1]|nr:lipid-A-disaccharide synthase [Cyanothece sp. SIO1E1]
MITNSKARIFISTGEVSGDLQGAMLIEALWRQAERVGLEIEIVALGGDRMAQAGVMLLGHTSSIGSVGLLESLPYVWPTFKIQQYAKQYLQKNPPDLVVLIDYMGPNLSIGSYIRHQLPRVPIVYYIAPQEWVWSLSARNTSQIVTIADRLLAIFQEEARYFQCHGAKTIWVGHPLIDRMQAAPSRKAARTQLGIAADQTAVVLLPASRRQELKYLLPIMFAAAQQLQAQIPKLHFWIPLSLASFRQPLAQAIEHYGLQATLVEQQSQLAIAAADLAITKSGTVNLEIALMNVPQVVMYRVNPITAWIAKHILKFSIPFMSPTNLAMMKSIVPEFLQQEATVEAITQTSLDLLLNPTRRQQMLADYKQMRRALGEVGVCDRTAQAILELLALEVKA